MAACFLMSKSSGICVCVQIVIVGVTQVPATTMVSANIRVQVKLHIMPLEKLSLLCGKRYVNHNIYQGTFFGAVA